MSGMIWGKFEAQREWKKMATYDGKGGDEERLSKGGGENDMIRKGKDIADLTREVSKEVMSSRVGKIRGKRRG